MQKYKYRNTVVAFAIQYIFRFKIQLFSVVFKFLCMSVIVKMLSPPQIWQAVQANLLNSHLSSLQILTRLGFYIKKKQKTTWLAFIRDKTLQEGSLEVPNLYWCCNKIWPNPTTCHRFIWRDFFGFLMRTNLEQMSQENWPFMLLSCASQFVSFMNKYVNIILWCCWRRVGRCDLISYEHQNCTDVPGKLTLHNAPLMLIELKQVTCVEDHCPLLSLQIGWYHGTIVIVSWSHYHLF